MRQPIRCSLVYKQQLNIGFVTFFSGNGPEFEAMTKAKQKGNPKFSFLFSGDYYHYYTYKVNTEQAIQRQKAQQQQQMGYQQQPPTDWSQPPAAHDGWSSGGPPRPHLSRLDQQYPVQGHLPAPGMIVKTVAILK